MHGWVDGGVYMYVDVWGVGGMCAYACGGGGQSGWSACECVCVWGGGGGGGGGGVE